MKELKTWLLIILSCLSVSSALAQNITYSQPLKKDDYRHTEFEIIGKLKAGTPSQDPYSDHILIYKNNKGNHKITVYSPEMKFIGNVQLKFLNSDVLGVDFLAFPDRFMMLYQYQKDAYVYCKALILNGNGNIIKGPIFIDTSKVGKKPIKSRIYSMVRSDDRERILIYKINQDNDFNNIFYTFSYDNHLNLLRNSRISLPMSDKNSFLAAFHISNKGLFFFIRAGKRNRNSNINKADLIIKRPLSDTFAIHPFPLKNITIEKVKLKVDHNEHYIYSASLYSRGRSNDIEGLYVGRFDLKKKEFTTLATRNFKEKLMNDASGRQNSKKTFNDYYIRDLIIRRSGGFLITAEEYYTSSQNNDWNRMNNMYGPWGLSPYYYPSYGSSFYSPMSPYFYSPFGLRPNNNEDAYHYQDIAMLSYDSTLNLTWSNFIRKKQESEGSPSFLSFKMINLSKALLFIYNNPYRNSFLLTAMRVTPNGKVTKLPTLRGLDKGFQWMPRYGRQIGARTAIVPCIYNNYLSFAKIVF